MTQDDIKDDVKEKLEDGELPPTPFEYLILSSQYIEGFAAIVKQAFKIFCKTEIYFIFNEKKIVIGEEEPSENQFDLPQENKYISEDDYFDFQNKLRIAVGEKAIKPPEPEDPNEDPRVRRIKEKARERDRIKAKQAGKGGISLDTCLTAICCMGIGITPLNIGEMSYAAVGPIMRVMQDKEKYDIDIRSLLAGADSKKIKPKYWIRNSNE